MRLLAIFFALAGLLMLPFGIAQAMKPSVMPLATVLGSLVLPLLLLWWAWIFHKKAKK